MNARQLAVLAARQLAVLAALLVGSACGGAPSTAASPAAAAPGAVTTPAPTRQPGLDALPLRADINLNASGHSFQGGDDHVTVSVENRGRDIQSLVIATGPWLAEHGLAMGSTRGLMPDLDQGTIDCGPVYAGQSANIIVRALPAHTGTYHYEFRFFDREGGGLVPVIGGDGRPVTIGFDEVVDPVVSQIPGWHPDPSPST